MEERGYIARSKLSNGVGVAICPAGRRVIEASMPLLEAAAQGHLLTRLHDDDADQLRRMLA
ncbi:hypothetical protein [Streptomyces sp. NPDC058678]|uniref:hypothetical protein n=1 Tax=Streptomyces sp. NPDC058678 TaxID=3346595 RepID=UPI0036478D7F